MLTGDPATDDDIKDAEKTLRVKFAKDYKVFLKNFGFINADNGIEIVGIAKSKHASVVQNTIDARSVNPQVPKSMYVIEDAGMDGIFIWQDKSGKIYQSRPHKPPVKIRKNLVEYLKWRSNP